MTMRAELRAAAWRLLAVGVTALTLGGPAAAAGLTAQQALGKALFFDKSLSHAGSQSCASCHSPDAAFTDTDRSHPTSKGDNPALFGKRNAPSVAYMAFSPDFHFDSDEGLYIGGQFYDGRAATLEEQAKQPFVGGVEMGNPNRAAVIAKLQASPNAQAFTNIFGPAAFADTDTAYNNIANAIADYERSEEVSPFSSKYDAVLRGQTRLNPTEARGLKAFSDPMKGNCSACHISAPGDDGSLPLFTDFSYDNIGVPKNHLSDFLALSAEFNPDGTAFIDLGLGGFVGDPELDGAFKVTTLRNIALTAPYSHNGYFDTLEQVVDFYATRDVKPACADPLATAAESFAQGCWVGAEIPGTVNHDELGNLPLTARDKADIVAFLATLSDGYIVTGVPEPATWTMLIAGFGFVGAAMRRRMRVAVG